MGAASAPEKKRRIAATRGVREGKYQHILRLARLAAPARGKREMKAVLISFDSKRHALPAANAERRQALSRIAFNHLMHQRHQNPAAGCANGMTERNRSAVNVHPAFVPLQHFADG